MVNERKPIIITLSQTTKNIPTSYTLSTMRAFIALELPTPVRDYLQELGRELAQHTPPHAVRWVGPDGIHLTLAFLGDEVTAAQIPLLAEAMDKVAATAVPFHLQLGKLGCFPKPIAPRVIWVGIQGTLAPLQQLKTGIDRALAPLGFQAERRTFSPHLTLGRVKEFEAMRKAFLPYGQQVREIVMEVTALHLFHSTLTPAGAEYTLLHTSPLG